MAMNRIQFQPGMSMASFLEAYGSEALCRAALEKARWPAGFHCPRCGKAGHSRHERGGQLLLQCRICHHQASLIAGTVFESTKLPLTTWFLALFFITQSKNNVSGLTLQRHLGVCYATAWKMKHKLMDVMAQAEQTSASPFFAKPEMGSIRFQERKIGDDYCLRLPAFVLRPPRLRTSLRYALRHGSHK